ncbi:MAG TPA: hypothetical protein VGB53_15335 [Rubricoccaceae bacterium]|jgi:hypothetical protein
MTRLFALAALLLAPPAGAQTLVSDAPADIRAERLVAAWATGDAAPTVAAFADPFRAAGAVAVPRVVQAFARRYGALTAVTAEGTTVRSDGRRETVVALVYARGAERLRLTWNADGTLRTLARAPRPARLVAAR